MIIENKELFDLVVAQEAEEAKMKELSVEMEKFQEGFKAKELEAKGHYATHGQLANQIGPFLLDLVMPELGTDKQVKSFKASEEGKVEFVIVTEDEVVAGLVAEHEAKVRAGLQEQREKTNKVYADYLAKKEAEGTEEEATEEVVEETKEEEK